MIKYIDGNILDSNADVIFHQVNCQGVMGAGLAKQIREWCPCHYDDYLESTNKYRPEELLGGMVMTKYNYVGYICGIFGQLNYGRDKKCYTDYEAVKCALIETKKFVSDLYLKDKIFRFAVPYKMSCGLAGGNWNIIIEILDEIFGCEENSILEIWKLK